MIPVWHIVIVFLTGLLGSFYGVSAGGSGLLMMPVLLFLGLTPQSAVPTALAGYLGMCTIGLCIFHRADKVDYRIGIPAMFFAMIGAFIGSHILLSIPEDLGRKVIAVFILCIVALLFFRKEAGTVKRRLSRPHRFLGYGLTFLVGVQTAIFAMAGSVFMTYIFIFFFGQTYLESVGTRKIVFLGLNGVVMGVLGFRGLIHVPFAITLFLGIVCGSYLGAHFALRKGDMWVRILFLSVTLVSAVKLLIG